MHTDSIPKFTADPAAESWVPLATTLRVIVAASLLSLQACAVVAVADAAVTVVATGVKVAAKGVGAVAAAVIPGGD
jgi:hypothetical protein